jgi:hypothetical protein
MKMDSGQWSVISGQKRQKTLDCFGAKGRTSQRRKKLRFFVHSGVGQT